MRRPLSLCFNASKVTLSGFAGWEYSALPASKGLAFPLRSAEPFGPSSGSRTHVEVCSPSMGTPLLQQIMLRDNGFLQKLRGRFPSVAKFFNGNEYKEIQSRRMRLSRDEFEILVSKALKELPKKFRDRLENIVVVVEDDPPRDILHQLGLRSPQRLLGLYQGVPLKHRGMRYGNVLPDQIVIYQRPIEALARTRGELLRQIRRTVIHEIGHYFGLTESDLREIEGDE